MTRQQQTFKSFWLITLSFCSLLLFNSSTHAAKLYKWIDENGQIRYSDRLSIEQAQQKHQTLSNDGRILGTTEAAIPPEQLKREREERKRLAEEARFRAENIARQQALKDHHDNVLMMTFSNEEEIDEAREERVAVIDSVIRLLQKNIQNEQSKLERLENRAFKHYIEKDQVAGILLFNPFTFGCF